MSHLNVRPYNNHEILLFPPCIDDYLEDEHPVRMIDEVVETLNLTPLYEEISNVGNPSYHPKMLVKLIFYAYANKTFSSRKIAEKTKTDVAFIYLSGMQKPDFRTISDFRKNNIEFLNTLFVEVVKICQRLGMIGIEHMSCDGSVFKANASNDKSYTLKKITQEEEEIQQQIKELFSKAERTDHEEDEKYGLNNSGCELPDDINTKQKRAKKLQDILSKLQSAKEKLRTLDENKDTTKKKINLTDNDAQIQKDRGKKIPGYRGQIMVDAKEQVIVACDITSEQSDVNQAIPITEQTLKNLQIKKENSVDTNTKIKISADSGYSSGNNLKYFENKHNIDAYIPDKEYQAQQRGKQGHRSQFNKEFFEYISEKNCFICPEGNKVTYIGQKLKRKKYIVSIYRCNDCINCKHFGICTTCPQGRSIYVSGYEQSISNMREKLSGCEGKKVYSRRQVIVEPVFGNIKHNLGFREFLVRNKEKVRGEFALISIVHNIVKISGYLRKLGVSLNEALTISPFIPVPSG